LVKSTTFSNDSPPVVILSLLNAKLKKKSEDCSPVIYRRHQNIIQVERVVYHGSYHFTARIIDGNIASGIMME